MNILIALAGEVDISIEKIIKSKKISFILAVDGGNNTLKSQGIQANIIMGDFDSIDKVPEVGNIITLNKEKDFTDFEESLKYIDDNLNDVDEIYVVGFMSQKRPEHFYNNLNLIRPNMFYISKETLIYLLNPGIHDIKFPGFISFFAYQEIKGLTLTGFKYPLKNKTLKMHNSLCISNELTNDIGTLSFKEGKLLVFLSINEF